MSSLDCSFVGVWAGVWHDGVMFNNESVLKCIARRVFPNMGAFSSDGITRIDSWDACLSVDEGAAWLTVSLGRDHLFRIEVRGSRVQATYALPAVVGLGEFGTAWAGSRCWRVGGWDEVPEVSAGIRKFFDNDDEYLEEEARVYEILEGAEC